MEYFLRTFKLVFPLEQGTKIRALEMGGGGWGIYTKQNLLQRILLFRQEFPESSDYLNYWKFCRDGKDSSHYLEKSSWKRSGICRQ
jgi:hypothetical protein